MPEEDSKEALQPKRWSRRQFVRTAVAGAAVGAASATGAAVLVSTSQRGATGPRFRYWGVKVLPGSKAPRGIPIIPTRSNASGEVVGQPDQLEWYRYCGRNNAPGLRPDFPTDNVFRYAVDGQVLRGTQAEGIDAWYADKLGRKVRLEDFDEVGKGAPVLWRSEGHEPENPLTCLLIRVDPAQFDADLAQRFFPDGILGVFATCAHLCLVPTWRASRVGYGAGHWDDITCFGHGSWYSPRDIVEYEFPPTA